MLKSLIGNAKGRCGSTESRTDGGVSTVLNRKRCAGSVSVFRPIIKKSALISLIAFSLFSCNFGKGKISVEIIYPEKTLVNPSLSVTAQPAGGKAEEYKNKDGKELLISPVEAGNYSLIIRLKDGETVVWEKTVSCVVDGAITTRIRYTITEADFTGFALYPPEIIVTELGDGRYKIEILSVNYKGDICYTVTQPAEDPTASSPKYTTPFEIDYATEQGKVLTARVFYKDFDPSEPAVLYLTKVETPALQDTTAHRLNDKLTFSVTSSDTQAKYYYTLDGTVPNAVSSQTNGVIALTKPGTITVKGFKESYLMSDSVVLPVERLPKPVFGPVTENTGGLTYTVTIDYGNEAEAMFLTRDRTPVTSENCPIGTEIGLTGNPKYTVSDLTPEQTLKTRSIAVNFFASEEAVLESRAAEKPVITDARAGNATWADPLAVVFTSPEPGAVLRYTFDGSMPTQDSPSAVSGVEVPVTVPTENETDVTVRSYVDGKYPSSPVSVKTVKATAPKAVALNYWNRVEIEESDVIDVAEKATRRLFYRIEGSEAWLPFEGEVYLNATAQTTVEAVGGSEFYFPSEPVTDRTFTVLAKPAANDARTGGTAYLDPLRVTLSSNGVAADAVKYYYTVDGTEPTRISSTEAAESGVVSVGRTETLKAVATGLNRITSEVSDSVDGTPLNPPKLSVDDTGTVTITAADADQSVTGIVFYYKTADTAFSSAESGIPYDGSAPPQLNPGETLYAVAAAEMRNPSEKATLTLAQTDSPVFTDTRANLFYKPLSVAISGNNVLYAEGLTENDVKDPNRSYTDPVNPVGTSLWIGATAKDDEKLRSDLATRELYRFAGAASVTVTHSAAALNLVTITGPTAPAGFTGAVAVYYILDGTDFADSTTVQSYTNPFTVPQPLVEDAWVKGNFSVKIRAGGEFCHPSSDQSENIPLTATPSVTDARTEIYKTLKVTAAATAPDDTATVYSSADGTTWSDVTGEVTVTPGDTLRFIAAVDGKLTSQIEEVDGTPLNPPTLKYENDGSVSVTAAAENGGNEFYYIVGDTADFETGTASELNGTTIPADEIPDGQTVFVVAAEAGKNPSEPAKLTSKVSQKPVITDNRGGDFSKPLEMAVTAGPGAEIYVTEGTPAADPNGSETPYSGPITPAPASTSVKAAAREPESKMSDVVEQELYALQGEPVISVEHKEGQWNRLTITYSDPGYTFGKEIKIYYSTDGSDPTTLYSAPVALPADTAPVTVKAVAGAEFCHTTGVAEKTFARSTTPTLTDARGGNFFEVLSMRSSDANVFYAVTDSDSQPAAADFQPYLQNTGVEIQPGKHLHAVRAETNFLVSVPQHTDGTPLPKPAPQIVGTDFSYADYISANSGVTVYYAFDGNDPDSSSDSVADGTAIPLDSHTSIKSVAVQENRNKSSVDEYSRDKSTSPTIEDARAGSWNLPLSVAFKSTQTVENFYYELGSPAAVPTEGSATNDGTAVTVAAGNTSVQAAAKETGKSLSDPVEQEFFTISKAPEITISHSPSPNTVTLSVPADAVSAGYTGTPAIWYTTDGSEPTAGTAVKYTVPFTLPADGSAVTVRAVIGGEFCHQSTHELNTTIDAAAEPGIEDARNGDYFASLSVKKQDTETRTVYSSVDGGTSWQEMTASVSVGESENYRFIAVEEGKAASAPVDVTGTRLPEPQARFEKTADGQPGFTYTYDFSVNGVKIYYGDAAPTMASDNIDAVPANPIALNGRTTVHSAAAAPLRNPSTVHMLPVDKAEITVQDARGGNYYRPLSVTFNGVDTGESVTVTDGVSTLTWSAGDAALDISSMKAEVKYVLVSDSRYSDEKSFDPTGLTAPLIEPDGGQIKMTHSNPAGTIWYAVGESTATAADVKSYTVPFTPTGTDPIFGAVGAELKHPAETEFSPTLPKAEKPVVTDSRTATGPSDYLTPAFTENPKSINLIIQPPTDGSTVYVTDPSGAETPVTGGSVKAENEGTYTFVAKGTGLSDSEPTPIEVKQLTVPTMDFKSGKVTLTSDGDAILYNCGTDPVADVTAGATEYGGPFDAVGGEIVKAVAVGEFCFASEQMTETIPDNEPLSIWFERDGKTINSQYLSEAIDVTICVPAEYETRTIRYALKNKNEPAPGDAEYVSYTVGTPVSIDVSSDLYAQVMNADGTAVEQSATLKIRLQCPHPNPILEVNDDKTGYFLSFTSLNDPLFEIKVSIDGAGEETYAGTPIPINSGNTYSAKTSRSEWEDSGTVGGTVPEILKKKGLTN